MQNQDYVKACLLFSSCRSRSCSCFSNRRESLYSRKKPGSRYITCCSRIGRFAVSIYVLLHTRSTSVPRDFQTFQVPCNDVVCFSVLKSTVFLFVKEICAIILQTHRSVLRFFIVFCISCTLDLTVFDNVEIERSTRGRERDNHAQRET